MNIRDMGGAPGGKRTDLWRILLLLSVLAVVLVRTRLLEVPLERDEGEYAYAGQLLREGIPPYKLAYNMKFPGVYAAYALLMSLFGETTAGIHFGLLLVSAASTALVFFLGSRLFDGRAGAAAAALYGVACLSPSVLGLAAHATHFVVLFTLAGLLLLRRAADTRHGGLSFAAGLAFGLAVLMKQHAVFLAAFALLSLIRPAWNETPPLRRAWLARGALFCLGAAVPFALTCVLLWRAGVFRQFWFWTITYASTYAAGGLAPAVAWWHFRVVVWEILRSAPLLFLAAAVGVALPVSAPEDRCAVRWTLLFLICSFLAVCPGFYFREHYFLLVLPGVALLAGRAFSGAERLLSGKSLRFALALLLAAALGDSLYRQREILFALPPVEVPRRIYGLDPFPEAVDVARYIRSASSPRATIAVLGSEPEIYFYARRHSATGYIYTYGLTELHRFARQMQEEMIRQIEAARPDFLVFVSTPTSWLLQPGSDRRIFKWFQSYWPRDYDVVGLVNIRPGRTESFWGKDVSRAVAYSPSSVTLLARRRAR